MKKIIFILIVAAGAVIFRSRSRVSENKVMLKKSPLSVAETRPIQKVEARVMWPAPKSVEESPSDRRLRQITALTKIVLPTERKTEALRPLLNDPEFMNEIRSTLNSPEFYSGVAMTRKFRLLDALYEGLKFPERSIRKKYLRLTAEILSESAPESYAGNPQWLHQFRADRAEIALALLKALPRQAEKLRATPNAASAFNEAERLKSIYEVSL